MRKLASRLGEFTGKIADNVRVKNYQKERDRERSDNKIMCVQFCNSVTQKQRVFAMPLVTRAAFLF